MIFFTQDEYKIKINDNIIKDVIFKELNTKYNKNKFYPLDGKLIKACDKLTAF
jgi:putative hydrolase of HD superfamily